MIISPNIRSFSYYIGVPVRDKILLFIFYIYLIIFDVEVCDSSIIKNIFPSKSGPSKILVND
jgi:hypothetical protein